MTDLNNSHFLFLSCVLLELSEEADIGFQVKKKKVTETKIENLKMVNGFECSPLKPSESKSSVPLVKALFLNHDMFKYSE